MSRRVTKIIISGMSTALGVPAVLAGLVQEWRRDQLEAAGYPASGAQALSESKDVDLHRAVNLLRAGCPVETALRILL